MNDKNDVPVNDLEEERDTCLSKALSFLENETESSKVLENINTCLRFMSTYNVSEVDEKLLQWVMPTLKTTLQKAFDDNLLFSDTCDEEFVISMLKQNLKLILDLIEILKNILEFIIKHSAIYLADIKNVTVFSIQMISSTFDHCRKSSEIYKKNFNSDLLNIFNTIQDVHSIHLQLLESHILVTNDSDVNNIQIVLEVLDNLCLISENLFFLNVKLLATNWKGYIGITQKFMEVLKYQMDLKKPIEHLTSMICDNFSSISDPISKKSNFQTIKLSSFLIKVVLKIFEIFWDYKEKNVFEIMEFCSIIYSYSSERFLMTGCSLEMVKLIDDTIFAYLKPFVLKFLQDDLFPQVATNKTFLSEKYCFGFLNFLNSCLEYILILEENQRSDVEVLIRLVFDCAKMCYENFFWSENIFDKLIINICAVVLTHEGMYEKIEIVLLENILQQQIWNYFLSSEVWYILLRNSNPQFCADTFTNLVNIHEQLNFGFNTYRLENVFLLSFIKRVFSTLPDHLKCQSGQSNVWKKIGFEYFPKQMKSVVEDVLLQTSDAFETLNKGTLTVKDFVLLAKNLECMSTINYHDMNVAPANLLNAVATNWELPITDTNNNFFRYFIVIVCKITSHFNKEFSNKQLYMILNRLMHLAKDDFFKLHVCFVLHSLCHTNTNRLGQDGYKMLKLIAEILSNLLFYSNNIIKQLVVEILESFDDSVKYHVVRDVLANTDDATRRLITDYLQKKIADTSFDAEYIRAVGKIEYVHECRKWKNVPASNGCKRIKLDTFDFTEVLETNKTNKVTNYHPNELVFSQEKEETNAETLRLKDYKYKLQQKKEKPAGEIAEDNSADEVIVRLKGEVKCLMGVLKSDKLSAKNVSDLKVLTNKLMSLM